MVYDRNDPTGTNLSAIFALKGYIFETQNGMHGVRITTNIEINNANPALDLVKLRALNTVLHGAELTGMAIISHGQPVTRRVGVANTTLLINKN